MSNAGDLVANARNGLDNVRCSELSTKLARFDLDPGAAGNWLVTSIPISQVMLCGDNALPLPVELDPYAEVGVEVFLAAYGSP